MKIAKYQRISILYKSERNQRKTILILFILIYGTFLYGQKKISYQVTEETYYEISPSANIKNVITQDLILMKPSRESYKITRTLNGNKIEETKEYIEYDKTEAWLPDIKKIITNNNETRIYNSKGELIFQREHPLETKALLNAKASNKDTFIDFNEIPEFVQLKSNEEFKGAELKEFSNGKYSIKRNRKTEIDGNYLDIGDFEEIEVDKNNGIIKTKVKNSQNHEKESEDIYLKKLPNDKSKSLKEFERSSREHASYSDIYRVKYVLYENYIIDDKAVFNDKNARQSLPAIQSAELPEVGLKVFPNPSYDEVTVFYPSNLVLQDLEIYNMNGVKIPTTILSQSAGSIRLDVSNLSTGLYLINLRHSIGILSQKIIKN